MIGLDSIPVVLDFVLVNLPFLVLAVILGFGPGFIIGIIIANQFFGHGKTYLETHEDAVHDAIKHNSQWHPDHEKWEKE